MRALNFAAAAAIVAAVFAAGAARADDYDNALRCMIYIELAKENYTAANVDALRAAGDKMVEWTDSARPADLTDQQKLDRWSAALAGVQQEGGLSSPAGRQATIECAGYFDIELTLPEG